jgi:hypothetical protein
MSKGRGSSIFLALCSRFVVSWRKPLADEIPVPCVAANSSPWILQWFELQSTFRQPDHSSVFDQALPICRDEVRHSVPLPHVTVEPQPTIHRVDHSIATLFELDIGYGFWQPIHPHSVR